MTRPPIVVCDFDGTITVEDVTNLIWDAHVPYDWRAVLIPPSSAGLLTPLALIARGYAEVRRGADELLDELAGRVHLRAGFDALIARCRERGWPLHVVSHGLDFYLRAFLPPGVPFTCFEGTFEGGCWRVALPASVRLASGEDFKVHVIETLRARTPGHPAVYVGDGRLDFPAARHSERVFAVRGSTLVSYCRGAGVACAEFDSLEEVANALAGG